MGGGTKALHALFDTGCSKDLLKFAERHFPRNLFAEPAFIILSSYHIFSTDNLGMALFYTMQQAENLKKGYPDLLAVWMRYKKLEQRGKESQACIKHALY